MCYVRIGWRGGGLFLVPLSTADINLPFYSRCGSLELDDIVGKMPCGGCWRQPPTCDQVQKTISNVSLILILSSAPHSLRAAAPSHSCSSLADP